MAAGLLYGFESREFVIIRKTEKSMNRDILADTLEDGGFRVIRNSDTPDIWYISMD